MLIKVFCEMTVDGGWTLIQKHNGQDSLSFEREWDDYKMGFGNISGEHWLGLDNIYMLTNQNGRISELKIHLGAFGGDEAFALYNNFKIGPERRFYQLSLGSCLGDAGDAFRGRDSSTDQNHNFFSTSDKDHDQCKPCRDGDMLYRSCTSLYSSGWWFNRCGIANLNGNWHPEENHMYWRSSIQWGTWREYESLKFSMMMLRHH
ncbi:angiopoietin-related protein 5-like [Rhinophrynus dorsalis]